MLSHESESSLAEMRVRPLKLDETAIVLGCSDSAVYKWSAQGKLRAARAGYRLRFTLDELGRFLGVRPDSLREAAAAAIAEAERRRRKREAIAAPVEAARP